MSDDTKDAEITRLTRERDEVLAERARVWQMRADDNAAMVLAGQREVERLTLIADLRAEIERCNRALITYELNIREERAELAAVKLALEQAKARA